MIIFIEELHLSKIFLVENGAKINTHISATIRGYTVTLLTIVFYF